MIATVNNVSYFPSPVREGEGFEVISGAMDYEAAARKLIVYSQGLAKGSLGTARSLAVGEAPVLQYLSDKGTAMNPSVLADTLGYTRPRMTRILDSLVYKGYVERRNDEKDRRKVLVSLTKAGRAAYRSHRLFHRTMVESALEGLSDEEELVLARSLNKVKRFFDEQAREQQAAS